jgi:hypothetical protein
VDYEFDVFELDDPAVEVPRCSSALMVRDDRAFDAEIVRGAIVLYNLRHAGPTTIMARKPSSDEAAAVVEKSFGWVAEVIRLRAEAAEMEGPLRRLGWTKPTVEQVVASSAALMMFLGPFRSVALQFKYKFAGRELSAIEWLNEVLRALPIYSWYRHERGHVRLTSVPLLRGVQECVAYAVSVVQLNRWQPEILSRIRPCPYFYPEFGEPQNSHYFLDFRLNENGELEKNRQRFCCPEHANRFKQRKWRHDQASGRKPK